MNYKIDNLQYCNWSRKIFEINRSAGLDAVHVTIVYHEDFDELLLEIKKWDKLFHENSDLIFPGKNFKDIDKANKENKTAIFFGFQNCSPIEDDIGLVEKVYQLGCRFMQLTYNNQSLLATGCYEKVDSGVTNFGREVIREMNRMGLVVDMSHSAEKSTLDAIELSDKPIAITHANPSFWHPAKRNKSSDLLKNLSDSGGMLGLSLYPHHL
jgi:microsomal dipeptidase-like Zn-dependent dipeptidase